MNTLLPNKEGSSFKVYFSQGSGSDSPNITMSNEPSKNAAMSEDEWRSAWAIYRSICAEKFSEAASLIQTVKGMAIHESKVSNMMKQKGDWKGYDMAYRRLIQKNLIKWGQVAEGLYSEHLFSKIHIEQKQKGVKQTFGPSKQPFVPCPKGFCVRYHKGQCKRDNCKYKHSCFICGKKHPYDQCQKTSEAQDVPSTQAHSKKQNDNAKNNSFRG